MVSSSLPQTPRQSQIQNDSPLLFMSAQSLTLAAWICPPKPGFRWAPSLNGSADLNREPFVRSRPLLAPSSARRDGFCCLRVTAGPPDFPPSGRRQKQLIAAGNHSRPRNANTERVFPPPLSESPGPSLSSSVLWRGFGSADVR